MKPFKIRCSQLSKIMGDLSGGLTEKQKKTLCDYELRNSGEGKQLTENMLKELVELRTKSETPPELPDTCKTYLKEWYAEQVYGDREEIRSKYMDKGNACENEAIYISERMLGYFMLSKNDTFYSNEWCEGTPDVVTDSEIIDTKCPWSGKTFLDQVLQDLSDAYKWQGIAYMWLAERKQARFCFCLVNTPEYVNYGTEVRYDDVPDNMKFHAKTVLWHDDYTKLISDRVEMCRRWLEEYHAKVCEALK